MHLLAVISVALLSPKPVIGGVLDWIAKPTDAAAQANLPLVAAPQPTDPPAFNETLLAERQIGLNTCGFASGRIGMQQWLTPHVFGAETLMIISRIVLDL